MSAFIVLFMLWMNYQIVSSKGGRRRGGGGGGRGGGGRSFAFIPSGQSFGGGGFSPPGYSEYIILYLTLCGKFGPFQSTILLNTSPDARINGGRDGGRCASIDDEERLVQCAEQFRIQNPTLRQRLADVCGVCGEIDCNQLNLVNYVPCLIRSAPLLGPAPESLVCCVRASSSLRLISCLRNLFPLSAGFIGNYGL